MLRLKASSALICRQNLALCARSSRLFAASRYNSTSQQEGPSLLFLRDPGDDPDRYRDDEGTFGGRVIQQKNERIYSHTNVLELIDRPEPPLDLVPTLKRKQVLDLDGLFATEEDAERAVRVLDRVNELGAVPSWNSVTATEYYNDFAEEEENGSHKEDAFETQLTRIQELKSGDKVVVIGAGVSGLSLAWFLGRARPDLDITLLEQSSKVGGWMQTEKIDLPAVQPDDYEEPVERTEFNEWGPRTLQGGHVGSAIIRVMLTKLGVVDDVLKVVPKTSQANRKGLLHKGYPFQLPSSTNEILAFLSHPSITRGIKLAPFRDLLAPSRNPSVRDESVESYITRRFGAKVSERFVSAIMRGIYAGDVSELSARSVARLGKMYPTEVDNPSVVSSAMTGSGRRADMYAAQAQMLLLHAILDLPFEDAVREMSKYSLCVFKDGIQSFAELLERDLVENVKNVHLLKRNTVSELRASQDSVIVKSKEDSIGFEKEIEASWVVSTIPGYSVASILKSTEPELAQQIDDALSYATVGVVNVTTPNKFVGKNWFGYLVPKEEDAEGHNPHGLLGVIFNTAVRTAARDMNRIPLPHPFEAMTLHKKDSAPGESFLDNYDPHRYEDEHLRKKLFTDAPELDKDQNPVVKEASLPDHGNITLMFGGHLWSKLSPEEIPSEASLIASAKDALKQHLGEDFNAEDLAADFQVKIQQRCIPQYTVGHRERMQQIKDNVSRRYGNRLALSGMSFGRGVGIGDNVLDSFWLAARHTDERKLLYPAFYLNQWLSLSYPSVMK